MQTTKRRRFTENPNLHPPGTKQKHSAVNKVSENLPPWWLLLGLCSVVVPFAHNAILDSFVIALWLATFYLYGIQLLGDFLTLRLRDRKWFVSVGTVGITLLSAPQLMFAQATGGGSCANAGFLNKLADFSTQVLTSTNTGGSVSNLNAFMCQFIGMLALIAILMVVGGFIYAGFEVIVRQQALATVAQPVVGIVIVVIFCVATIYIMTNPV